MCIDIQNTRPYAHCVQKHRTLGQAHTVYRHTKHSATRTLCAETQNTRPHAHCVPETQNTRPHAHCVQKHKTLGHTHTVYRQPTQTPQLVFQRDEANDQLDNERTFVVY